MSASIVSAITKAISKGFTAKTILQYLSSKFPQHANKIANATALGYTAETILKHLINSKDKNINNDSYLTDSEKTDKNDINMKRKAAIGLGATALGAAGLGSGLLTTNAAIQASQVLPSLSDQSESLIKPSPIPTQDADIIPQGVAPQTPGQQIGQGIQAPITEALQPSNPNQIAQASQAIPSQPQTTIFDQLLGGVDLSTLDEQKQDQLRFLAMVSDKLQSKGKTINDPEFKNLANKIKNVISGKPGMILEESARFSSGQEAKKANVNPLDIEQTQETVSSFEPAKITKPESIKKGQSVVTEEGNIAEVKGTSGNNFLIEENGKVRQVSMDSLRAEPEVIKKAKIVFDPSKIPESNRSASLAISLPMPDKSAIINMFHDGSFYIYRRKDGKPIEDSIIQRIIEGQDIPISTGETFMGAWNQDSGDSRGSASFKELTAMSQDATKPDDPTKPLIFEKITNSFTHGYLKEFQRLLKEANRMFSAKPKKNKK